MKKVKAAIGIIILSLFLILAGGACKKALPTTPAPSVEIKYATGFKIEYQRDTKRSPMPRDRNSSWFPGAKKRAATKIIRK